MDPMTIASIISTVGSLAGGISGAMGSGKNSDYKSARDALRRQQEYLQASVDPTHPWYQALTATIRDQLQREASKSVVEDMRLRRRAIASGNLPAGIDASRRDEARSQGLAQAWMNAFRTAQTDAASRLAQAGGQSGNAYGWLNLTSLSNASDATQRQNQSNLLSQGPLNIGNLVTMFGNLFGGGGGTYGTGAQNSGMTPSGMMLRSPYTGSLGGGV